MPTGTDAARATGDSGVDPRAEAERSVNDEIHDTGKSTGKSHATGPSKVPEKIQSIAPKGLEDALPEKIHPTK